MNSNIYSLNKKKLNDLAHFEKKQLHIEISPKHSIFTNTIE